MRVPRAILVEACAVILSVAGLAARGAVYYTAADGDDGGPGSPAAAWRSIQKAANTMAAGDTVIVRPGVYDERVSTVRAGTSEAGRITFQAESNVVMRGFSVNHSFITVSGFDVAGAPVPADGGSHIEVSGNGDYFQLLNTTVRDGIQITRPDMMFSAANRTITSSSGGFLAAGFAPGQIVFVGAATNGLSLNSANSGTHLIEAVTDDSITVADALTDQGPLFVYLSASLCYGLSFGTGAEGGVIRSNVFQNLGYDAWFIMGSGHLLEYNVIGRMNGWDAMHFGGTGHLFRRNLIRESPLVVYQISPDAMENYSPVPYFNVTFASNMFHGFAGVLASQKGQNTSSGLLVTRNVFVDVGRYNLTHPGSTFENNTFFRVGRTNNPVVSRASHPILLHTALGATNAVIRNNVFLDCGQPANQQTPANVGWYEISGSAVSVVAEGNFVAGASPGFGAKAGWNENPDLNGGDPGLVNINDPLGSDGLPFTEDDGLRPLSTSKLVNAGVGGGTIGAYGVLAPVIAQLDIALIPGEQLRLSWSDSLEGWSLETAASVAGRWTNVPGGPLTPVGGFFEVELPVEGKQGYFRLAR